MLERIVKGFGKYVLAGGLVLTSSNAQADDLFKGVRGPTPWQLDIRYQHSRTEDDSKSTALSILKYWDGDKIGKWFFAVLPYEIRREGGFNSVSAGGGLRGRVDNLNWISYSSVSKTQDGFKGNVGAFFTLFFQDKEYEVTGSVDYGINDGTLNMGFVAGGNITDRIRLAPGFKISRNEGDYAVANRWAFRYTFSRSAHFELLQDFGVKSEGNPKTVESVALMRYNF
jgi:hypothetical protein